MFNNNERFRWSDIHDEAGSREGAAFERIVGSIGKGFTGHFLFQVRGLR